MTLVLNRNWGGFALPSDFCKVYGFKSRYAEIDRWDARLVRWVRDNSDERGRCGDLACVEVPDTCTDFEIHDYDGRESIIYVVNGKIHHA